MIDTVLPHNG
jgi:hypothetical protein